MITKSRDVNLDIAKGIAILLVVIGHTIQFGSNGESFWNNPLFKVVYSFHMPLFMFLSGYATFYSKKSKSFLETIKNKFITLLVPFFVWGIIMYFYLLLGNLALGSSFDVSFVQYQLNNITNPGQGLWFLWVLFFLHFFLSVINKLPGKNYYFALFLYLLILFIPEADLFYIYMIKWLVPFFFIGYFINKYKAKLTILNKPLRITLSLLFPVLLLFWRKVDYVYISKMTFNAEGFIDNLLTFSYRYLIAFAGIALTLYLVKFLNHIYFTKLLSKLGKYTLDIYVLQAIFLRLLTELPKVTNQLAFNLIYVPIVSLFILVLSVLISKYILRKIGLSRKLLLGGR